MNHGRPREALFHLQRSHAFFAQSLGARHPDTFLALTDWGKAHLALGDARLAAVELEQACTAMDDDTDPREAASAHFAQAQAWWTLGKVKTANDSAEPAKHFFSVAKRSADVLGPSEAGPRHFPRGVQGIFPMRISKRFWGSSVPVGVEGTGCAAFEGDVSRSDISSARTSLMYFFGG